MENLGIKELYYQEKNGFKSETMYSICLDTLEEKLVIVSNEDKKSSLNNLNLSKATSKLNKFEKIIKDWNGSYISKHSFDGITYKIVVINNDGSIKKIIGRNKFPNGFNNFVNLVSSGE